MNRRFLMSLTFVLIFSLVALVGCTTEQAQEKPITDIEDNIDMQNGMGDSAYDYNNKANRLYGYFGSQNMGNDGRMSNGINNPGGNSALNNNALNNNALNNNSLNNNYGLATNPNSNFMGNNANRVLTGSQSNIVRKLESNCNQIKGINDTTIVKNGNTCYVGVDLSKANTSDEVASIKSQCVNKIKNLDPSINNVVFTSDKNAKSKLETMIRNVNIGRPARGFMNDLENLFR